MDNPTESRSLKLASNVALLALSVAMVVAGPAVETRALHAGQHIAHVLRPPHSVACDAKARD
jgi:hypothetical protein